MPSQILPGKYFARSKTAINDLLRYQNKVRVNILISAISIKIRRFFWGRPKVRSLLVLLLDCTLAACSLILAFLIRFEGQLQHQYTEWWPTFILFLIIARFTANSALKLHRWSFRFSGLSDAFRVGIAGLLGSGLFLLLWYFYKSGFNLAAPLGPPRSVVVLEFFFTTTLMGLLRFSPRMAWMYLADLSRNRQGNVLRTLIIGAGGAGEALLRDLSRSRDHNYKVIGFLDDDEKKWGAMVGSRPVFGGINLLHKIVTDHQIHNVLIAIPRVSPTRVREILSLCADVKVRFKILPLSFIYLNERAASSMLQDLSPEDLLPREKVKISHTSEMPLCNRSALVTGAAGSIGSEICRQLLENGVSSLYLTDINENGLYLQSRLLQQLFGDRTIIPEVADIRDNFRIDSLVKKYRPNDIFHAAAHKHVPLMEASPCEAIKNNVFGTIAIANAAHNHSIENFIFISTDKAVRPTSIMGASKRLAEMIILDFARRSATKFCAVRFGNVLGSAGSVVELFKQQISLGLPVTVTHPDVRRYFMTISEAVGLVLKAGYGEYGDLCVLDMGEQFRIVDLARAMITMSGLVPEVDIPIRYIGLRPGEKLYEELLTEQEEQTIKHDHKIMSVVCPEPPASLRQILEELQHALDTEDSSRVKEILRQDFRR